MPSTRGQAEFWGPCMNKKTWCILKGAYYLEEQEDRQEEEDGLGWEPHLVA